MQRSFRCYFMVARHGQRQEVEKKIDTCKMWIWRKMLRVSRTEKRTDESMLIGDRTSKRGFVAETEGRKTENDVLWPCDAGKWYGKGYDAGGIRTLPPDALSHSLPDYRHTSCIHSLIGRFYTNNYSCAMTSLLSFW